MGFHNESEYCIPLDRKRYKLNKAHDLICDNEWYLNAFSSELQMGEATVKLDPTRPRMYSK